jgi:hypothetical protein
MNEVNKLRKLSQFKVGQIYEVIDDPFKVTGRLKILDIKELEPTLRKSRNQVIDYLPLSGSLLEQKENSFYALSNFGNYLILVNEKF